MVSKEYKNGPQEELLSTDYMPHAPLDIGRAHCVERHSGTFSSRTKTGFSIEGSPRVWDGKIKVYSLSDFDNADIDEKEEDYRRDVTSFLLDQSRGF